ncbi:putative outer membrane protein [Azospirillum agricola]|uniref:DUF4142 domain-containing protein n=1 Tax=Azospirillum agricola TaxID=1720247 RepID=UPI001AE27C1F|nr:DUF4142 domain-containing protein [Azospirillum agricola]MBP2230459.1 putative outer membrane protein [Azospirillum agricola]
MKKTLLFSATMALLLSGPAVSLAQQPSRADLQFAEKAAISDQFEIQTGQLAAEKAQKAEVKAVGQQMVADHGKTSAAMKTLAQAKGMTLPAKLDAEHQQKLDQLKGLSGGAFDSAYIKAQVEAHQTAVALFETQAKQGQDAGLKQFAQTNLPTLKQHLQHVQSLQ